MAPLVTVIVPNYNHALFLRQRLESIFNQTFCDYEIIILDDCSTDNSKEIIEEFKNHPKVSRIVFNDQNSNSAFRQWTKGIGIAKGEYIWIAESDDWSEPSFLATVMDAFNKHPEVVLSYVQSYFIEGENKIKWISKENELEKTVSGGEFIKSKLLLGNSIFNASMAVFKKSAFYQIDQEYIKFKFCGDWFFWIEIAKKGSVFISGRVLNYFRNHGGDISNKAYSSGLNYVEELYVLLRLHDDNLISEADFLLALNTKFLNYKFSRVQYSISMVSDIENLFYRNNSTKRYKRHLIIHYYKELLSKKTIHFIKRFL